MNKEIRLIVSCLAVISVFACLVAGQQQATSPVVNQQPILAQPICESTTTKPYPETKKYVFKSCIVAQLAAYLALGDGKYISLNNGTVNANASQCDNSTLNVHPKLIIDFDCGQVEFSINHTNDSKTFVSGINGSYNLNGTTTSFTNSTPAFYTTQSGHYYKCNAEQTIVVKPPSTNLVLSNFAYEAYRTATGPDFYQIVEECALDSQPVSDLVRIGVGVCLIALVAIVLIAYFIGRRRWAERSSYESV